MDQVSALSPLVRELSSPSTLATSAEEARALPLEARAPFRSRAEAGPLAFDATLEGSLPRWLDGDLVRTAPAVFSRKSATTGRTFSAQHWFDALGMLYGFKVDGERGQVRFRQRLMETEVEKEARAGAMPIASFGSPIERGFWRRVFQPIPKVTDNTNVNVVALGDQRVALTESPYQWAIDPETLAVQERVAYADRLGDLAMTAHPHFDFREKKVVNVASEIGPSNALVVMTHGPEERTRQLVGKVKVARLPYMHGFGITPKHAVLIAHPFDVNPLAMLWSNKGFIDHFRWRPEAGTQLHLLDRSTGAVRTHLAPAGFVFHVVNAFEDGERTVLDVALYRDASVIDALRRPNLEASGLPALAPSIVRYTMTPGMEHAAVEVLLEDGFEFPSVSYRKKNGARHDVSWGARVERGGGSTVVRLDARGNVATHREEGMTYGEPVFVAKPGTSEEDAGVLLTVGAHATEDRSTLLVLDAHTLEVLARASVPLPIPLGFHGSFFRTERA
jgi:beta,beta-carotene 9',10'-dioxygenase